MESSHKRGAGLQPTPSAAVAVIGASCRLPGGVDSVSAFWELLRTGQDVVSPAPAGRWDPTELASIQEESERSVVWCSVVVS